MKNWRGIVKIQRPLAGEYQALVYSRDRDVFWMTATKEETDACVALCGDRPKVYARAYIHAKTRKLHIGRIVEDQTW